MALIAPLQYRMEVSLQRESKSSWVLSSVALIVHLSLVGSGESSSFVILPGQLPLFMCYSRICITFLPQILQYLENTVLLL